jgi:hypothetical protein
MCGRQQQPVPWWHGGVVAFGVSRTRTTIFKRYSVTLGIEWTGQPNQKKGDEEVFPICEQRREGVPRKMGLEHPVHAGRPEAQLGELAYVRTPLSQEATRHWLLEAAHARIGEDKFQV